MITQNPLIGRARKSMANFTATTLYGKNVIKSKPISVKNPRSPKQVTQRSSFGAVTNLYTKAPALFSLGFIMKAIGMAAYNAFTSYNQRNGLAVWDGKNITFAPEQLIAAKGSLQATPITGVKPGAGDNSVDINWNPLAVGDQTDADVPLAVVMDGNGYIGFNADMQIDRTAGTITVALDGKQIDTKTARVALFFYQDATRKVSNSVNEAY